MNDSKLVLIQQTDGLQSACRMKRRRFGCVLLWLLLVGAVSDQLHGAGAVRALASRSCPVTNCSLSPSVCVFHRKRGWRCLQCATGFKSFRSGMQCVCPAGQFASVSGCIGCPINMYCPLGQNPTPCPNRLITISTGAASLQQCVNPPGYKYVPSPINPKIAACEKDAYSLGGRFQTECSPCPSGFATSPTNVLGSHSSVNVCIAPPGFVMISSMVVPCSKGTFSSNYSVNYEPCTKCSALKGPGVTTEASGAASADSCTWVEQGYVAVSEKGQVFVTGAPTGSIIARARPCPQNYYCPGGSPFDGGEGVPKPCPNGLRTQNEGAFSADQCVAPPGFYVVAASGTLAECPDGWYKESWDRSNSCLKCGQNPFKEPDGAGDVIDGSAAGWRSIKNVTIEVLDPSFGTVLQRELVRGSPDCCYLRRGMASQRVFDSSTGIWRLQALYCPTSDAFYGLSSDYYGMALIPCGNCVPNMLTSCSGVPTGSALANCMAALEAAAVRDESGTLVAYASAAACVLQPGWGWVNMTFGPVSAQVTRAFVQPCPVNTFSPGGAANLPCANCTTIAPNYTTRNMTGQVSCTEP